MKTNRSIVLKLAAILSVVAALALVNLFAILYAAKLNRFVTIKGVKYNRNITEICLSASDLSSEMKSLSLLKNLKTADLTRTDLTAEQYERLAAALPACRITWNIPLGTQRISSDTQTLTLTADVAPEELKNIRYFTRLRMLDATGYPLCDALYQVTAGLPDETRSYHYRVSGSLYGKEVTSDTFDLDLSDRAIDNLSEFYEKMRFFPQLQSVYVGDIAVPDEEMDKLNLSYPDTKFIWLVEFGVWQVRTDIQVFSSLIGANQIKHYDQTGYYPLLTYCTDLVALDLGHNELNDISCMSRLKNLEILILCGFDLTDISVMRNFQKLHYLELFDRQYNPEPIDLAPLGDCPYLQEAYLDDLGKVKNLSALAGCKNMKMLFGSKSTSVDYSWYELRGDMPDCAVYLQGRNEDFNTLRMTMKNRAIRNALSHWSQIKTFEGWENITYNEQVTFYY